MTTTRGCRRLPDGIQKRRITSFEFARVLRTVSYPYHFPVSVLITYSVLKLHTRKDEKVQILADINNLQPEFQETASSERRRIGKPAFEAE